MHVDGDWRDHDVFVLESDGVPKAVLGRLERRQQGHEQG